MRSFILPIFILAFSGMFRGHVPAQNAAATLPTRRAELKRLLNDEWEYTLPHSPELATNVGDDRYNDGLSDFSDKVIADELEHNRQALKKFEAIDVTGFPEEEQLNQALVVCVYTKA